MFKIENLRICLDRNNAMFHGGETILGSLDFTAKREIYASSIRLIVDGYSSFDMYESEGNKGIKKLEGYEPLLKFFINFLPADAQVATLLNPGDYSYRFEIKLPNNLPPSFCHGSLGTFYSFI